MVRQPNWPKIYSLMSPSNDSVRPSDQATLADTAALDGSVTEAFEADLGSEVKSLGLPLAGVPLWPLDFGKGETILRAVSLREKRPECAQHLEVPSLACDANPGEHAYASRNASNRLIPLSQTYT